jgi:lambda family phage portal protein
VIMWLSPSWGQSRVRARVLARHFEAAAVGRRTSGWNRTMTDPNAAASGATLARLRAQGRDLERNNPWATEAVRVIKDDTVGWGIKPKATGRSAARVMELWEKWGETKQCDAEGQSDFYALQALVMRTIVVSGEVLVRRRLRRLEDGLVVPMQLEVLEPDYIDTDKDNIALPGGGRITLGIETDAVGRRVAYYLFDQHPGGNTFITATSRRIPAHSILHIYDKTRAQQKRGHSWFAPVDVRLHEFDEYEDATLMKQKIASCMAAFVTDVDGGVALAKKEEDATGVGLDAFEPGMIHYLPPGKNVQVANPPTANDYQPFSTAQLRGIAAGFGIPYEALTGDFSQVNYSSARMAWNKYTRHIHSWRWHMLIPMFCTEVWLWFIEAAALAAAIAEQEAIEIAPAEWTPPPMPFLDPDAEGKAMTQDVRAGRMSPDEMVRAQGYDPERHWKGYAASFKKLDDLGIVLDCDPRKTNNSGQAQASSDIAASTTKATSNGVPKNGAKKPAATADDTAS